MYCHIHPHATFGAVTVLSSQADYICGWSQRADWTYTVQFQRANLQLGRKKLDVLSNMHAYMHSLKTPVNAGMVHLLRIPMYTGKLIKNTSYLTENNAGYYHRLTLTVINIRSPCYCTHESGMSFNIVGIT
jgi:hypothetical protein